MASKQHLRVVPTVKRDGRTTQAPTFVPKKKNTAAKEAAKASRKVAVAALLKKKPEATIVAPVVVREEPHVLKRDEGKPLVDRLNPKLLKQLRERKVTNEDAAMVLGVHGTYLSRVLKDLGEEKFKGVTTAHREARSKLAETREQFRATLAKKVNRNEISVEKAAKEANCTVRTMFRWCAKYGSTKKTA